MSRSLSTQAAEATARTELRPVTLAIVDVFSDRAAGIVGESFYFATRPVRYDLGGTGTAQDYSGRIRELGNLTGSMNHLPTPDDRHFTRDLEITLANEPYTDTQRLSERLRATYPLENAQVTLAQIALLAEDDDGTRLDLSSWAGTEHTVLARMRVERINRIDDEDIELRLTSDLPSLVWERATDASTVDPRDLGARYPIVYGMAQRVRCVSETVGWATTLAGTLNDTQTGAVEFTDISGFPQTTFTVLIGRERIDCVRSGDTVTISSRGQDGTVAAPHKRGEIAIETVPTSKWIAAGHACSAIPAVYIRNPDTDELVKLRATDYTANENESGRATISMTPTQIQTVFDELFADVELDTQTSNEVFKPDNIVIKTDSLVTGTANREVSNTTSPSFAYSNGDDEVPRCWFGTGFFSSPTDEVSRWRIVLKWDGDAYSTVNSGNLNFRARLYDYPNADDVTHTLGIFLVGPNGGHAAFQVEGPGEGEGPWVTPPANTTLADFEATGDTSGQPRFELRAGFRIPTITPWASGGSGIDFVSGWGVEFEFVNTNTATLSGASYGSRLELFADVNGYVATSGVARQLLKGEESATFGTSVTAMPEGDLAADWDDGGASDDVTFADDTTVQLDGSSVRADVTDIVGPDVTFYTSTWTAADWSDKLVQGRVRIAGGIDGGDDPNILIALRTATDSRSFRFSGEIDRDTWYTFVIDVNDFDFQSTGFDITEVTHFSIRFFDILVDGADVWIDELAIGDAPASPYKVGVGSLIEHPADVFRHFVTQVLGVAADDTSVTAAETDLGSDKLAVDLRSLGVTTDEILAHLGYLSRANIVPREGTEETEWQFLTANADYTFDASAGTVDEVEPNGIVETGRSIEELGSRFVAHYAPDPSREAGEDTFREVVRADPSQSDVPQTTAGDLADVEELYGVIEAQPEAFVGIQDEATAEDVLGYYVHERARSPRIWTLAGVPWWQAYAVTEGDIRTVSPPWLSSSVKVRVLEFEKPFDTEQKTLRVVEVE